MMAAGACASLWRDNTVASGWCNDILDFCITASRDFAKERALHARNQYSMVLNCVPAPASLLSQCGNDPTTYRAVNHPGLGGREKTSGRIERAAHG
jgi:hypothetical protein